MINKIYNRLCRGLWCCGVAVALTACTDTWDEHYDGVGGGGIHEGTLWEAIKSNPELSNFASVVEACDFAKSLNSSQVFTVFAPTNANFSKEEADALISDYKAQKSAGVIEDDNTVLKEFVQNHVALYNYSVATESRDSIQLMNGKYAVLRSNDIAGVGMITKNQLYGNGVLYTLKDKVRDGRLYVDQGIIAGCAGGGYENITDAADILRGASIGPDEFTLSVYPASTPIYMELVKNGSVADLMATGAIVKTAFCGP